MAKYELNIEEDRNEINSMIRSIRLADKTFFEEDDVTSISLTFLEDTPLISSGEIKSKKGNYTFELERVDGKFIMVLQTSPDDPYLLGKTTIKWLYKEFLEEYVDEDSIHSVLSEEDLNN